MKRTAFSYMELGYGQEWQEVERKVILKIFASLIVYLAT